MGSVDGEQNSLPPEFYPCEECGRMIPADYAYAEMETLEVRCPECLRAALKPCDRCGAFIRASAYQELGTGRVICEPCVLRKLLG